MSAAHGHGMKPTKITNSSGSFRREPPNGSFGGRMAVALSGDYPPEDSRHTDRAAAFPEAAYLDALLEFGDPRLAGVTSCMGLAYDRNCEVWRMVDWTDDRFPMDQRRQALALLQHQEFGSPPNFD